ncbi:MAG: DNA polymerase I [Bacteriovoracaceae bacterium]
MKRLIVVDISSFIFRAFYAIRANLTAPDGTPVNAVRGVWSMLQKLIAQYQPTHFVIAKDTKEGSFRSEIYPEYKANRSEPPEELIPQFAIIQELVEKMQLPHITKPNYEADDIIGSIAVQWKDGFDEILIASGDKDLMQFVNEKVKMLDTMKDKIYDEKAVFEKMGVRPDQIVDYLSLVGDASDNIPGVKGIGAKGAAKLLGEYQNLEACFENVENISAKRMKTALENHRDDADLSKRLIQIPTDLELGQESEDVAYTFQTTDELVEFFKKLDFKTVLKQIEDMHYADHTAGQTDQAVVQEISGVVAEIEKEISIDDLVQKIAGEKNKYLFYNHTESPGGKISLSNLVFRLGEEVYYTTGLEKENIKTLLTETFKEKSSTVIGHDVKPLFRYILQEKIQGFSNFFDLSQVHYNIDTSLNHRLGYISKNYLGLDINEIKTEDIDVEALKGDVWTIGKALKDLHEIFEKELHDKELEKVYNNIDKPLIPILAHIEHEGIQVDTNFLKELEEKFTGISTEVEDKIEEQIGEKINLRSPKQVGELLFEKLELPTIKKTKTGFSTDSEVLEELNSRGLSEIPGLILKYREVEKLNSTYVKALPELIDPETRRIHTHLQQNVAATGRLSSVNPNLQNIPIRSDYGKMIRKAFEAKDGHYFIGADYSQVELRILAHLSDDQTMIEAFKNNIDIHARTASEVLSIALDDVTPNDRSKAKAVNFGLMYGQSSFGLAKALKISRKEAKQYIEMYFQRFSAVKSFLDSLKELCERNGYSETMYGRKRYLPDIRSQNRTVKANAERVAINSPIQGTAADIIKLAMIEIDARMRQEKVRSKMILQVHDELIFECPEAELETMQTIVREGMENIVRLKVPLTVDVGVAQNWYDLK